MIPGRDRLVADLSLSCELKYEYFITYYMSELQEYRVLITK